MRARRATGGRSGDSGGEPPATPDGSWWWGPTTGPSSSRRPSLEDGRFPGPALPRTGRARLSLQRPRSRGGPARSTSGSTWWPTVRARPLDAMAAQAEFGVICALQHGNPLVVAGVAPERPFGPWAAVTVEQGGDW